MRRLVPGALAGALLALASNVHAHPLAPSLLELHEGGDGHVGVGWKTPLVRARGTALTPVLPARCPEIGPRTTSQDGTGVWTRWVIDCGAAGLVGEQVGAEGGSAGIGALVRVTLADGRVVEGAVTPARPLLTVPAVPRVIDVVTDYVRLGIEHILTGPDHLLFVFGLLLLTDTRRRLLATVTAFTLGHSVTLTLAALGLVDLPSRPIEAAIAASVLALAVELARDPSRPTLMRRYPWVMAAAFGLLHGLGFASALREAGLPAGEIPLALASFNGGIEVGQLLFVGAVLALWRLVKVLRVPTPAWARQAPVYVMGVLSASWWIERTMAWLR